MTRTKEKSQKPNHKNQRIKSQISNHKIQKKKYPTIRTKQYQSQDLWIVFYLGPGFWFLEFPADRRGESLFLRMELKINTNSFAS